MHNAWTHNPDLKRCPRCEQVKSRTEFYKNKGNGDGISSRCAQCEREYLKDWQHKHRDRRSGYEQAWRKRFPDALRKAQLRRDFGLSLPDYKALLVAQDNMCAICGAEMTKPHVDHDHTTGVVRGLLCVRCNFMLGYARDDRAILRAGIEYLRRSRVRGVA